MNQTFKIDQFTAANEAAINQFAHFAQMSLANLEKFAAIGLDAARDSVEQATAHAASLAGAKDVHEVIAINSAALEPVMKRAYAYSRTVYETAAETNAEVKKVIEKQTSELSKSATSSMEEAFKYAPAGSMTWASCCGPMTTARIGRGSASWRWQGARAGAARCACPALARHRPSVQAALRPDLLRQHAAHCPLGLLRRLDAGRRAPPCPERPTGHLRTLPGGRRADGARQSCL